MLFNSGAEVVENAVKLARKREETSSVKAGKEYWAGIKSDKLVLKDKKQKSSKKKVQ